MWAKKIAKVSPRGLKALEETKWIGTDLLKLKTAAEFHTVGIDWKEAVSLEYSAKGPLPPQSQVKVKSGFFENLKVSSDSSHPVQSSLRSLKNSPNWSRSERH